MPSPAAIATASTPAQAPGAGVGSPDWRARAAAELGRVADRDRWGLALMGVGWVHLATFVICEAFSDAGFQGPGVYLALWALEMAAVLGVMRRVAGRGWVRTTPMAGLVARVWLTFLILSFNVASLNHFMGPPDVFWFKPTWATLSTFGFATTAYLLSSWFFVPAVQMYFTGLLMAVLPDHCYVIYGVSWWLALQGIGLVLARRPSARGLGSVSPGPRRS